MSVWRAGLVAAALGAAFWLGALTQPADPELEARQPGWSHDFLRYYRPNAEYAAQRWARGEVPLWNPHHGFGGPFLATLQPAALYPPNALHLLLDAHRALLVLAALHLGWSAFAMAGLAGALGAGRVGAGTAGCLYAASGAVVGTVWTPTTLYAACWLPAVLWAVESVRRRPTARRAAALALASAAQALTGWIYVVVMTALTAAVYAGVALACDAWRSRRPPWRAALALGGGALAGGMLAAPLLLPAQELVGESTRAVGSLVAAQATASGLHDPAHLWARLLRFGSADAVPGWGALVLAALGVLLPGSGRGRVAALALAGALALGVSFPFHLPLYDVLRELPLLGDFRFPYRYRLVTNAALCAAAGVGITHIAAQFSRWPGVARGAALAVAALAVGLQAVPISQGALRFPRAAAPAATPAERLAEAGVTPGEPPLVRTLWAGLSERLGAEERLYLVNDLEPLTLASTARLLNLFQIGRPITVLPPRAARRAAEEEPAAAPAYGLVTLPPTPGREKLLDLAAVGRIVARDAAGWWDARYPRESAPDAALPVYRNPDALPRAYRVAAAVPEPAEPRVAALRLLAPDFDPRRLVMLSPMPPPPPRDSAPGIRESTRIERYEPERVRVRTAGPTPAVLVLTDAYFPGWRVRVDGEPAPLLRANTAFRAVVVPAGEHEVEFRYRPTHWGLAWALAVVAAAAIVAALRSGRREKGRRRAPARAGSAPDARASPAGTPR